MQRVQNIVSRGASGIIAGIVCCIGWQNARTDASRPSTLQESFTSQHILDKTVALFPIVNSLAATSTYSAEYFTVQKRDGAQRHIWIIDCANSSAQGLGHCIWDADTGQLIEVLCLSQTAPHLNNALNSRKAVNAAETWLLHLGLRKREGSWYLASAPEHDVQHWTAQFRNKDQTAVVMMDEAGNLVALHNR